MWVEILCCCDVFEWMFEVFVVDWVKVEKKMLNWIVKVKKLLFELIVFDVIFCNVFEFCIVVGVDGLCGELMLMCVVWVVVVFDGKNDVGFV